MDDTTSANFFFWKSIWKTLKEYANDTSMPGYRYVNDKTITERRIRTILNIVTLLVVVYVSTEILREYTDMPIRIWQDSFRLPVVNIDFPAVSICSNNKISRKKAIIFRDIMSNRSGMDPHIVMENIHLLGSLYDFDLDIGDVEKAVRGQQFFEKNDWNKSDAIDTYELLKILLVDCDELLSDCAWDSKPINCSELFFRALSMEGPCCVFNYLLETPHTRIPKILVENKKRPLRISNSAHIRNALSVKIHSNVSDYMYQILSTTGTTIIIGNPRAFNDPRSGGTRQALGPVGVTAMIFLSPSVLVTSEDARILTPEQRNCYFPDEKQTVFGEYNYQNCISECKLRTIVALCQCVPFQYHYFYNKTEFYQCNLNDLPCLNKHKGQWSTLSPNHNDGNLNREELTGLRCNCLPSCSSTIYTVRTDNRELFDERSNSVGNYSILHIEFNSQFGFLLQRNIIWFWYDMIANFGGFCSLFMGLSLLSLVEIIFYASCRLYANYTSFVSKN